MRGAREGKVSRPVDGVGGVGGCRPERERKKQKANRRKTSSKTLKGRRPGQTKMLDVSRRISAGWGRALASVTRSRRNRYAICSFGRPHRRDESVRLRLSFRARARTVVLVVLRSGPRSEAIGEGGQKRDVARDHGLDEGMRLHGVRRRSGGRDGHTGHEELVAHAGRNEARRMRRVS